jgi:F plasmid transfer operon, TraF, protein
MQKDRFIQTYEPFSIKKISPAGAPMKPDFPMIAAFVAGIMTLPVAQADNFHGKTGAMGGAGVASADLVTGMSLNPASLAAIREEQGFNIQLNAGALTSDEDDLIDNAEGLRDRLDVIDRRQVTLDDIQFVADKFNQLANKSLLLSAGASAYLGMPTSLGALAVHGKSELRLGATTEVDQTDLDRINDARDSANLIQGLVDQYGTDFSNYTPQQAAAVVSALQASGLLTPEQINQALATGSLDTIELLDVDDIQSEFVGRGAAVTEAGITFARRFQDTSVGITVKAQRVDVIEYRANVQNFDEDDFDADQYRADGSGVNVDLGIQHEYGNWRVGAVASNLMKETYTAPTGHTVTIEPRLTLGAGYRANGFTLMLDADANAYDNMITGQESQFARAGIAIDVFDWAQLRLGYKSDLKSVIADTTTVGLGFRAFGTANVDIAAITGDNDTVGAILQLGLSF